MHCAPYVLECEGKLFGNTVCTQLHHFGGFSRMQNSIIGLLQSNQLSEPSELETHFQFFKAISTNQTTEEIICFALGHERWPQEIGLM